MRIAGVAPREEIKMPARAIDMKARGQLTPILAVMRSAAALHHFRDHLQGKQKISKHA
jgi:hypothetical protein